MVCHPAIQLIVLQGTPQLRRARIEQLPCLLKALCQRCSAKRQLMFWRQRQRGEAQMSRERLCAHWSWRSVATTAFFGVYRGIKACQQHTAAMPGNVGGELRVQVALGSRGILHSACSETWRSAGGLVVNIMNALQA